MRRPKKINVVQQPSKIPWRVSQRSISLACDQFFIARGMLNREPFNQWRRSTAKPESEDKEEDNLV
jgi:hypothetical protein